MLDMTLRRALAAVAALGLGCGRGPDGPAMPPPADSADAGGSDAQACAPATVDAGLVDGMILGLPSADVGVWPPLATPQVAVTAPEEHFPKQVGVLDLSPQVGDVQSVVHMLAPMGMPYAITTSPVLAIQHDMTVFFPEAGAASFDATALQLLEQYLQGGGVVVMKYSEVDALKALGGVASSAFQLPHHWVDLTDAGKARFPSLDQPFEQDIPLGGDP